MNNIHPLSVLLKPLSAALVLAALSATVLSGCNDATSKMPDAAAAGGPPVSAATVVEKSITETQEFSGRLEALERVDIRSRVGGFITAVNFKAGSAVKKGQVLFVIDPRPYQAEANRVEAAAAAARAKADLAKLELRRAEHLLADKAIAQREVDEKTSNLMELTANARAAQASFEAAQLNLSFTQVRAPIDGRVGKAEITLGNLIDPAAILTSVVSDQRIYASFDGDEETYLRLSARAHQGAAVAVNVGLANETGFPHQGKLEFIDNQLDPKTGSVRLRAIFNNADHALAPGLFARIELAAGNGGKQPTRALLIAERAVGTDQNRKFVFVVGADGKAEYRLVKLGQSIDGLRVVREGLKAGEVVVVNGLQRVHPGAPLTAQMVAMESDTAVPVTAAKPKDAKMALTSAATSTKE